MNNGWNNISDLENFKSRDDEGKIQYVFLLARYPNDSKIWSDMVYSWWNGDSWARWDHNFPPEFWRHAPDLPILT